MATNYIDGETRERPPLELVILYPCELFFGNLLIFTTVPFELTNMTGGWVEPKQKPVMKLYEIQDPWTGPSELVYGTRQLQICDDLCFMIAPNFYQTFT